MGILTDFRLLLYWRIVAGFVVDGICDKQAELPAIDQALFQWFSFLILTAALRGFLPPLFMDERVSVVSHKDGVSPSGSVRGF